MSVLYSEITLCIHMHENTIITNMTPVTAEINLLKVLHFLQLALHGIQEKLMGLKDLF